MTRAISRSHWCLSEVGHTTSTRSTPAWRAMISTAAIASMVFPSPMSSPMMLRPARPEPHLAPGTVVEIDLAEHRLDAARQGLAHAQLSFQPRQGELDVLARPQRVRREVRARAEVVPRLAAPDHHPVAIPRERIGDLELRGDRMAARAALEEELLLAAELPAQLPLPRLERQLLRPVEPRELRGEASPAGAALLDLRWGLGHRHDRGSIIRRASYPQTAPRAIKSGPLRAYPMEGDARARGRG